MSANVPNPAGPAPEAENRRSEAGPGVSSPPGPHSRRRLRLGALVLLPLLLLLVLGAWLWRFSYLRAERRLADEALKRHDLTAAAAHLDRHLARNPRDADAWFLAGRTARRVGRFSEAERYLSRCQEIAGVTDATRLEWDLLRVQQGDLGEVHARLRATIPPDHPDAPFVLEALAHGYLANGRLFDVVEACDRWSTLQPDHPWPWLWRGVAFERLANFPQALDDYHKALDKAPEDHNARLALAQLYLFRRRHDQAAEHFEHVLARSPNDPEAMLGLAACRIEQGRAEDALPLLEQVLADDPDLPRALFLRGKVALALDSGAAGAERWLSRAFVQAPYDPEILHQLILALRAQGKQGEADGLAPKLESLRKDLARLNDLTRAVGRKPDDFRLRHEAGVVALRMGRTQEGVRWLHSALRLREDHAPTHAALAEHYQRLGDPRAEHHRRLARTPE